MWAQDAVAMYGYAAASASASRLIPFAAPPKTTNSAGVVAQAVAVAAMPGLLQRLSSVASVSWPNPNDWWLVRLLGSITPTERTTIVRLLGQSYLATGMARFLTSIAQQLTFGPGGTTAGSGGAWYPTPQFAGLGAGPAVSASLARAEPVGRLSVPPSWAVAAPAFAEKPEAGTPMSVIGEASSCGQGGLLRGIPLARAGRRTGAFAHRYGFRHSVITRSPSAG
ncbi:PPE family protein PPE27 [Mycobacterium tuberculosis XTB13-234]|uniref:PPE family protein n=1 Tax=Mycobacterium tuberculosis TaxID=1773 RepID=UPI00045A4DDB|nr:PPE family protein PPE27 [Mycobacterium tuberculosis XTB13-234]